MRLLDLDPQWLSHKGRCVGFIFRCPLPDKRDWWQTCFVEKVRKFRGEDCQLEIVRADCPQAGDNFQLCNPDHQWTVAGGIEDASFATITVTPSLDGSRGGFWHGFITNGQIVGGL